MPGELFPGILDMKFSIVFDNSGDILPFTVKYNRDLFEFFVDKTNNENQNSFSNHQCLFRQVEPKITRVQWALSKTNEVLYDLIQYSFKQQADLENYLDQDFLNMTHCEWVKSQNCIVDIDQLRHSSDHNKARLGNKLHEMYSDDIRKVKVAEILDKLNYLYPYEEVNQAVHRLESQFNKSNLEFKADQKWNVFDNPYIDQLVSNNDVVNFSFGYTYVGRQYYDKFVNFDNDLQYTDHYNYEQLEYAFQLNLSKPQTIPFSKEYNEWSTRLGVKQVAAQIPIANLDDINNNLFEYRKILYRNSRDNNRAKIILQ